MTTKPDKPDWSLFGWDALNALALIVVMVAAFAALPGIVAIAWVLFGWGG